MLKIQIRILKFISRLVLGRLFCKQICFDLFAKHDSSLVANWINLLTKKSYTKQINFLNVGHKIERN